MTAAEVIHSNDEEAIGVERPAGTDDVVPPAEAFRLPGIQAGDMVVPRQRMADQDGVGFGGIQRAVGLINQVEGRHDGAAAQFERRVEMGALRLDDAHAAGFVVHVFAQKLTRSARADRVNFPTLALAVFIKRPQAESSRRHSREATVPFAKSQFDAPFAFGKA